MLNQKIIKLIRSAETQRDLEGVALAFREANNDLRDSEANPGDADNNPNERWYIQQAQNVNVVSDGPEIDDNAEVSIGDDNGAYVQAWVFVRDPEHNKEAR